MLGPDIPPAGLALLVLLGFLIATTVNTVAMEGAVLFVPAFLFVFPVVVPGFPDLPVNAAIGLALFVGLFGYSSSVAAYWYRHQIDFHVAPKVLAVTVPAAVLARAGSYYVPADALMLGFGLLLVGLGVLLSAARERGPSLVGPIAGKLARPEKPALSLLAVLPEAYEPRTRVLSDTNDAPETPPSDALGGPATSRREEPTGRAVLGDGGDATAFHLEVADFLVALLGGALAGLLGVAVGELTQTTLALRRRVPLQLSTGTSALVLHATIVAALVANVALLRFAPSVTGPGFSVPFGVGVFVATGCLLGGQAGAFLNNRLPEERVMGLLVATYLLVGVFVIVRTVVLGGAGH